MNVLYSILQTIMGRLLRVTSRILHVFGELFMLWTIYYRIFYKPIGIVLPQNIAQYVYTFTTLHHNVKLNKGL